jgi:chemotaxis protein MotB
MNAHRHLSLAVRGARLPLVGLLALMSVGSLFSGCYDGANERARIAELEGNLSESERQRTDLETQLTDLRRENDALAARLTELGENVESLRSRASTLEGDLTAAERERDELRERERQANERLATFRAMLERFRSMIDSGRLRVSIVRNRMVVELPDNVLFDSGQAELKPEGAATLAEVASVLASIEGRVFQIAGHTDNVPIRSRRFPSNWELSTARAVVVARYLIDNGNMTADRISAAGYADTVPIESNDTEEGRARNRRIEIVLMPNLDELPDLSSLMGSGPAS